MQVAGTNHRSGFTIVELLIVIVVLGILAGLVITTFAGVQMKARNTAVITGIKAYIKSIESYNALTGNYPSPPTGTSDHDYQACFGNNYLNNTCLSEDDGPGEINPQPWFDSALAQVSGNRKPLPQFLHWESGGNSLYAGSFYVYTKGTSHPYLSTAHLVSADALVVFYLEGNVPNMCKISGSAISDVYLVGMSTNKDLTICYIPLGNYVKQ